MLVKIGNYHINPDKICFILPRSNSTEICFSNDLRINIPRVTVGEVITALKRGPTTCNGDAEGNYKCRWFRKQEHNNEGVCMANGTSYINQQSVGLYLGCLVTEYDQAIGCPRYEEV